MGFNKRQHLRANIDALRIAFILEKEQRLATDAERQRTMQYCGFGGLKFVLNPINNDGDIGHWSSSEKEFFPLTKELHQLLRENAIDERQYHSFVDSLRGSVLTAFYTPPLVIDVIADTLQNRGVHIRRLLEPSAGVGAYITSLSANQDVHVTAYEKDQLTGKILKQLYPESSARISGFEEIPDHENSS